MQQPAFVICIINYIEVNNVKRFSLSDIVQTICRGNRLMGVSHGTVLVENLPLPVSAEVHGTTREVSCEVKYIQNLTGFSNVLEILMPEAAHSC